MPIHLNSICHLATNLQTNYTLKGGLYYNATPSLIPTGRQSALAPSSTSLCSGRRRLLVRVLALLLDAGVAGGPVPVFEVGTNEHER